MERLAKVASTLARRGSRRVGLGVDVHVQPLARRVVLSVPHFTFVRTVLESTDLVAMLPERIVRDVPTLRTVEPPGDIPGFEISMLWHERLHRDPAHRWLRESIANACR